MNTAAPPLEFVRRAFVGDCEVRQIDEENRTATFVAATENGVDTWDGKEHLVVKGIGLTRYRKNPVVLDSHDRCTAASIVGRAMVEGKDDKLMAEVTFAETERAEAVWQLVRGGFLRALSVSFMPREVKMIGQDETFKLGEGRNVEGPARIVRKCELYEISVVPVPADADALRRSLVDESVTRLLAVLAGHSPQESTNMADEPKADAPAKPDIPAPAERQPDKPPQTAVPELPAQRETRELIARNEAVLACTPPLLIEFARGLLLDAQAGRDDLLTAVRTEWARRMPPAGSREPQRAEDTERHGAAPKVADVPADELVRGLCG